MFNTQDLVIRSAPQASQAPRDLLNMRASELSTTELAAILKWRKASGDDSELPDAATKAAEVATAQANLDHSIELMKAKEAAKQAREAQQVAQQLVEATSYCTECKQKGHSKGRCQVVRAKQIVSRGGRRGPGYGGVQKRR